MPNKKDKKAAQKPTASKQGTALQSKVQGIHALPLRTAIKLVLRRARIAKDTRNRCMTVECREWLREHIPMRNAGKQYFWGG
jgi:hypothetical protein